MRKQLIPLLVFGGVAVLSYLPFIENLSDMIIGPNGWNDWSEHLAYLAVPVETVQRYGQFPLWNPFEFGGHLLLGHPENIFLTPFTLLHFLFGTLVAIKLQIIIHVFLAMWGTYLFCRYLKCSLLGSIFAGLIFGANGSFAFQLHAGHVWFLAICYLPWLLLFYYRGLFENRKGFLILSGGILALMIMEAGIYPAPFSGLFLLVLGIFYSLQWKNLKPLKAVFFTVGTAVAIGAVRIFPLVEGLSNNSRLYSHIPETWPFSMVKEILLDRGIGTWVAKMPWGWWEYSYFVGPLPAIFFIVGLYTMRKKELLPIILAGGFFFVAALGDFYSISLFGILRQLPIFQSFHVSSRFLMIFIFAFAIWAGFTMAQLEKWNCAVAMVNRLKPSIFILIIAVSAYDLVVNNLEIVEQITLTPAENIDRTSEFRQSKKGKDAQCLYPNYLKNTGCLHPRLDFFLARKSGEAKGYEDPEYLGEHYLKSRDGEIQLVKWSPNRIQLTAKTAQDDLVILNQNFDKGWRVKGAAEVINHNGLIAAVVSSGTTEIEFYYRPTTFVIGSIISILSALAILIHQFRSLRVSTKQGVVKK